jgi:hypothetical protein
MDYYETLSKQLINPDGYLHFPDASIHSYLDGIADDSFNKDEADGYIAALIIWHQLAEEILRLLYRHSQLLIKAGLYPTKLDEKTIEHVNMGGLIQIHSSCVAYDRKSIIMSNAKKLNDLRNDLLHDVMNYPSEKDIMAKAKAAKVYFNNLFSEWPTAMKWFYKQYDRMKNKEEIKRLISKQKAKAAQHSGRSMRKG